MVSLFLFAASCDRRRRSWSVSSPLPPPAPAPSYVSATNPLVGHWRITRQEIIDKTGPWRGKSIPIGQMVGWILSVSEDGIEECARGARNDQRAVIGQRWWWEGYFRESSGGGIVVTGFEREKDTLPGSVRSMSVVVKVTVDGVPGRGHAWMITQERGNPGPIQALAIIGGKEGNLTVKYSLERADLSGTAQPR